MAILIETRLNSLKLNESQRPRKGCLGRLEGICADFKNPTRNGRLYTLALWQNVFNDPIFKESLKSKTLIGELDHPADRLEPLAGEACVVMTDYRIDEDEGVIYGGFDILDTTRGRTLKSLLDYGCVMGVSSRGQGDITETATGEIVNEDTYEFACFDVVLTPAVEKARQTVVESVKRTRTFVESVKQQIKDAETINDLKAIKKVIQTTQTAEMESLIESIDDKCKMITEGRTTSSDNFNSSETNKEYSGRQLHKNSAKTIRENKEMYSCINSLRKQLSAYKHRESRFMQSIKNREIQIEKLQNNIADLKSNLTESKSVKKEVKKDVYELQRQLKTALSDNNRLSNNCDELSEQLRKSDMMHEKEIKDLKNSLSETKRHLSETSNRLLKSDQQVKELNQELSNVSNQLTYAESQTVKMNESTKRTTSLMESEINDYTKIIDGLRNDISMLQEKLNSVNSDKSELLHKYKGLTKRLTTYQENYISMRAKQMGVDGNLIKPHISVNTTHDQINTMLEDIQKTKDRYAKLPISESVLPGVIIDNDKLQADRKDSEIDELTAKISAISGL